MDDPFDLGRFVRAQAPVYAQAMSELRAGRKRSHWIWYVFPQLCRLGHSSMAEQFGIEGREEAEAYVGHELLGARLRECTSAVLAHGDKTANAILGYPDDLKFRSSMTLFAQVAEPPDLFRNALRIFFDGQPDPLTLDLLGEA